jgi:hypothetical protein
MGDHSIAPCEKTSSPRQLSVDVTILTPNLKYITLVITGDESEAAFIVDMMENAQEYMDLIRGERMGCCPPGVSH